MVPWGTRGTTGTTISRLILIAQRAHVTIRLHRANLHMIIEEMKAELQAAQQAASPPRDAEVEPDTAERRPNSKPPDTGPPGSPPESENGRN